MTHVESSPSFQVPLPFTWRRALFKTIAESREFVETVSSSFTADFFPPEFTEIIAKVQYGLKITFIFVALLFVDAVNQMLKIQREKEV